MRYLYLDNYRGFSDTFIPLSDVNFLVGENSTGKTSILAIVKLLSDGKFWYQQEFNTPEVELGTFKDIVSVLSKDASKFKIGLINIPEEESDLSAYLMTFIDKDGLPSVYRYDYYYKDTEVNIVFQESGVEYKNGIVSLGKDKKTSLFGMVRRWCTPGKSRIGFQEIRDEYGPRLTAPLLYIIHYIDMKVSTQKYRADKAFPWMLTEMSPVIWFAPTRTKPKRTYDEFAVDFTSEGSHTPYLIRKILGSKVAEKFRSFLVEFGRKSGLLDAIQVKAYGNDPISPFSLNIKLGENWLNLKNVGYGVSQSLPLVVELFQASKKSWFAMQQPEIHLHPRAQSALGDVVFELARRDKKNFLIETHSDYIVDRFRANYRKRKTEVSSQVLFFKRSQIGNEVYPIEIENTGEYSDKQPKDFREFFIREELDILGIR
jgi:hypothetical protein